MLCESTNVPQQINPQLMDVNALLQSVRFLNYTVTNSFTFFGEQPFCCKLRIPFFLNLLKFNSFHCTRPTYYYWRTYWTIIKLICRFILPHLLVAFLPFLMNTPSKFTKETEVKLILFIKCHRSMQQTQNNGVCSKFQAWNR